MHETILIVGAGQAGLQAAESLRMLGYTGAITLLGDEPYDPYHRPPLSKAWLAGEMEAAQLAIRSPEVLARKGIALQTQSRVASIHPTDKKVHLADGSSLPYGGLLLATGATPRSLPLPGTQAPEVLPLRSMDNAQALASALVRCEQEGLPVVVVGGGFIGLEVAATARKKGLAVVVLEAAPRLLGRVLSPLLADWVSALHQGNGVEQILNARIASFQTDAQGHLSGVAMLDGTVYAAGLVVLGVGVSANDQLAKEAGLACENGILVDACGRTSDPFIVAAGDCTVRRLADGSLLRLESVQNANEQAKSAAAALLGQEKPFVATPWFWSDQYDRKLQMAGISTGADQWVVRGQLTDASFSVFNYRGNQLLGVDSVNASREHLLARKLLDAGVLPTPEQAADTAFDLSKLLQP